MGDKLLIEQQSAKLSSNTEELVGALLDRLRKRVDGLAPTDNFRFQNLAHLSMVAEVLKDHGMTASVVSACGQAHSNARNITAKISSIKALLVDGHVCGPNGPSTWQELMCANLPDSFSGGGEVVVKDIELRLCSVAESRELLWDCDKQELDQWQVEETAFAHRWFLEAGTVGANAPAARSGPRL
jgi:hypothetical protein